MQTMMRGLKEAFQGQLGETAGTSGLPQVDILQQLDPFHQKTPQKVAITKGKGKVGRKNWKKGKKEGKVQMIKGLQGTQKTQHLDQPSYSSQHLQTGTPSLVHRRVLHTNTEKMANVVLEYGRHGRLDKIQIASLKEQ